MLCFHDGLEVGQHARGDGTRPHGLEVRGVEGRPRTLERVEEPPADLEADPTVLEGTPELGERSPQRVPVRESRHGRAEALP